MWYVMQVRTGTEENIRCQCQRMISSDILKRCFIPYYQQKKRFQGKWHIQERILFPGYVFLIAENKGGELFFTRKEKSITRSTVDIAFQKALELGEKATGPKKLGVFGASYLYPVFVRLGVINKRWQESTSQNTIVAEK